jgi:hypothetical protein
MGSVPESGKFSFLNCHLRMWRGQNLEVFTKLYLQSGSLAKATNGLANNKTKVPPLPLIHLYRPIQFFGY